jgi:hypothetical protein
MKGRIKMTMSQPNGTTTRNKGFARLGLVAVLLVAGMLLEAPSLHAISYNLTSDHCTGGCGTPPFGTVELIQNGANVTVTVTLAAGYTYAQTGAADGQIFKFNGVGVALGDITVGAHVPALAAATGALNGDGTGNFTFGINCPSCGNGPTGFGGAITFTVANATIADLTQPNNLNNLFVADVLAPNGNTGPVDVSVPEPASILLLGCALTGLGAAVRRLRRE